MKAPLCKPGLLWVGMPLCGCWEEKGSSRDLQSMPSVVHPGLGGLSLSLPRLAPRLLQGLPAPAQHSLDFQSHGPMTVQLSPA